MPLTRTSRAANGLRSVVINCVKFVVCSVTVRLRRLFKACGVILRMMQEMIITILIVSVTV